jgi:hypothetical protein
MVQVLHAASNALYVGKAKGEDMGISEKQQVSKK